MEIIKVTSDCQTQKIRGLYLCTLLYDFWQEAAFRACPTEELDIILGHYENFGHLMVLHLFLK